MLGPSGGSGGGPWGGTISVVPGNLLASAPGYSGAGDQIGLAMAQTIGWGDPAGAGITDAQAGSAWARLVSIWGRDLGALQSSFDSVSQALVAGAVDYHATDAAAMTCPAQP